jgi:hypothetical protein
MRPSASRRRRCPLRRPADREGIHDESLQDLASDPPVRPTPMPEPMEAGGRDPGYSACLPGGRTGEHIPMPREALVSHPRSDRKKARNSSGNRFTVPSSPTHLPSLRISWSSLIFGEPSPGKVLSPSHRHSPGTTPRHGTLDPRLPRELAHGFLSADHHPGGGSPRPPIITFPYPFHHRHPSPSNRRPTKPTHSTCFVLSCRETAVSVGAFVDPSEHLMRVVAHHLM